MIRPSQQNWAIYPEATTWFGLSRLRFIYFSFRLCVTKRSQGCFICIFQFRDLSSQQRRRRQDRVKDRYLYGDKRSCSYDLYGDKQSCSCYLYDVKLIRHFDGGLCSNIFVLTPPIPGKGMSWSFDQWTLWYPNSFYKLGSSFLLLVCKIFELLMQIIFSEKRRNQFLFLIIKFK